jgi:hypothetical protein
MSNSNPETRSPSLSPDDNSATLWAHYGITFTRDLGFRAGLTS